MDGDNESEDTTSSRSSSESQEESGSEDSDSISETGDESGSESSRSTSTSQSHHDSDSSSSSRYGASHRGDRSSPDQASSSPPLAWNYLDASSTSDKKYVSRRSVLFNRLPDPLKKKTGPKPSKRLHELSSSEEEEVVKSAVPAVRGGKPTLHEVQSFLSELKVVVQKEHTSKGLDQVKKPGRKQKFDVIIERCPGPSKEKLPTPVVRLFDDPQTAEPFFSSVEVRPWEPLKRGRPRGPPKEPKIPRKKGRPPKPRTEEELVPKIKKPRGRPPKPKSEADLIPKEQKKRGRPMKFRSADDLAGKRSESKKRVRVMTCEELQKFFPMLALGPSVPATAPVSEASVPVSAPIPAASVPVPTPDSEPPAGETSSKPRMIYTMDQNSAEEMQGSVLQEAMAMLKAGVPIMVTTNPSGSHEFLVNPKKRGRPKKIKPRKVPKKRGRRPKEKSLLDVLKLPIKRRGLRMEDFQKRSFSGKKRGPKPKLKLPKEKKQRGRKRKLPESLREVEPKELRPPEHNVFVNDPARLRDIQDSQNQRVCGYRARSILSCSFCQQWSWDVTVCATCTRPPPAMQRLLTLEEHEVISGDLDFSKPIFQTPPIPFYRPGSRMVFCLGCFYFTPADFAHCQECDMELPEDAQLYLVDFERTNPPSPTDKIVKLKLRWIDQEKLAECPHCGLTFWPGQGYCFHCGKVVPRVITITQVGERRTPITWPTCRMLENGVIDAPPPGYVPLFREDTKSRCRWCSEVTWDLHRCSGCFRRLPTSSGLEKNDGWSVSYSFISGKKIDMPEFSAIPVPYLRPGVMARCPECSDLSLTLRHCDRCSKRLQPPRTLVKVLFDRVDEVTNPPSEILPFEPRVVNSSLVICPTCRFTSFSRELCSSCGRGIPERVLVTPLELGKAQRMPPDPDPLAGVIYKKDSVFKALTLERAMNPPDTVAKRKYTKSKNYVPRYRERGLAQCGACLGWSWDFGQCQLCLAPMRAAASDQLLVIFPRDLAFFKDHRDIEDRKPKFDKRPVPNLQPGRVTLCHACVGFTTPPFCSHCGRLTEITPQFVTVDFSSDPTTPEPPGARELQFQPRLSRDGSLALCPHCGYTTENFSLCSYCHKDIPQQVLVVPEDPEHYSFENLFQLISEAQPTPSLLPQIYASTSTITLGNEVTEEPQPLPQSNPLEDLEMLVDFVPDFSASRNLPGVVVTSEDLGEIKIIGSVPPLVRKRPMLTSTPKRVKERETPFPEEEEGEPTSAIAGGSQQQDLAQPSEGSSQGEKPKVGFKYTFLPVDQ